MSKQTSSIICTSYFIIKLVICKYIFIYHWTTKPSSNRCYVISIFIYNTISISFSLKSANTSSNRRRSIRCLSKLKYISNYKTAIYFSLTFKCLFKIFIRININSYIRKHIRLTSSKILFNCFNRILKICIFTTSFSYIIFSNRIFTSNKSIN